MSAATSHRLTPELEALLGRMAEAVDHNDRRSLEGWFERLKFLKDEEQQVVVSILAELRDHGNSDLFRSLWQIDHEREQVSIDEFLDNPEYLGGLTNVYPVWREELRYVCDPAAGISEWILTGSFGSGKTYVSLIAQLYKGPYHLSTLRDPQRYYGLAAGTQIVFGVFNRTRENARSVDFAQLATFVDSSPYFRAHLPRKKPNDAIRFPDKNIIMREGSRAGHVIGSNLFGYLLDEANYMEEPKTKGERDEARDQAHQIYEHATKRQESRFTTYGYTPGLLSVVSSRKSRSSFLERHIQKVRGSPRVHVSDFSVWDTKGRERFSPKTFRVAIGNAYRSTSVLDTVDERSQQVDRSAVPPIGQETIEVPIDFYSSFVRDPEGSVRDLAGIPTFGFSRLIHNVESVHNCIDRTRSHPFLATEAVLPLNDPAADLIRLMAWRKLVTVDHSSYRLRVRPAEPRVIHVDLSLSGDCAGLACGHKFDYYTHTEYNPVTGEVHETLRPKVYVDFMLRIRPTTGTQIDIAKIVAFILNLRNFGIPLVKVTFDGYQSAMAIQIIQKAGQLDRVERRRRQRADPLADIGAFLGAGILSVDRDDRAYCLLRDAFVYDGISMYAYQPFVSEVVALEHDLNEGKVDHPAGGSKDCSDAVAGIVYNLFTMNLPSPAPPQGRAVEGLVPLHEQMFMGVAGSAIAAEGIQAIIPPPLIQPAVPPGRSLSSGTADLISKIARFGK